VTSPLYWTIWIALLLFATGEAGRRRGLGRGSPPAWAWPAFAAGAVLCAVHVTLAMWLAHGWSHDSAVAATARQTNAVYGLDWGGGVFANYAFVAVWAFDAWRWRPRADRPGTGSDALTWTTRVFFLIMILNGAVIFVAGPRRMLGAALVAALLWIWRPVRRDGLTSAATG
jgi:hypothetical protein